MTLPLTPLELHNASNAMMIQKHTPECALVRKFLDDLESSRN
jgi:hypothetical protein